MVQTKCGFDDGGTPGSGRDLLTLMGPTLFVDIGFDPDYKPTVIGSIPVAGVKGLKALVDTGATESCIDNLLAATLKLPVIDRRNVSGSAGTHSVNVYLAQVYVPALVKTIFGAFAGVELAAGGQTHSALIGRTFLRNLTMVYEGRTGTVTLSDE